MLSRAELIVSGGISVSCSGRLWYRAESYAKVAIGVLATGIRQ